MSRNYVFPKYAKCVECSWDIKLENDPFCYVVPHKERYHYLHLHEVPLCRVCRSLQGYDISTNYREIEKVRNINQPDLLRLEHQTTPVQTELVTELASEPFITDCKIADNQGFDITVKEPETCVD
jgi:hypothetical protein